MNLFRADEAGEAGEAGEADDLARVRSSTERTTRQSET